MFSNFVLLCVIVDCNSFATDMSSRGIVASGSGPTLAGNNIDAWTLVQCPIGYGWSDGSGNYATNYTCVADAASPQTVAGSWQIGGSSTLSCQRECHFSALR